MADSYVIKKSTLDSIATQTMTLGGTTAAMTTSEMAEVILDANSEIVVQAEKITTVSNILTEKGSTSSAKGETAASPITQNTADLDALIEKANALPDNNIDEILEAWVNGSVTGEYINDNATKIRYGAFAGTKHTAVRMRNATNCQAYAFYENTAITTIDLPSATFCGDRSFYRCDRLVNLNIPLVTEVSNYMIYVCPQITSLDLPSVTYISGYGFASCSALSTVILRANQVATLAAVSAFNKTPIASGKGYVYVPSDLVESYKTTGNWVTYADQIRSIDELEV